MYTMLMQAEAHFDPILYSFKPIFLELLFTEGLWRFTLIKLLVKAIADQIPGPTDIIQVYRDWRNTYKDDKTNATRINN